MALRSPSKTQWRILWSAWLLLSWVWTSDADRFSSALGVFGVPVAGFLALLLWRYAGRSVAASS